VGLLEERKARIYDFNRIDDMRDAFQDITELGIPFIFFRSRVIKGVKFDKLSNGEDCVFYAQAFCRSTKIVVLPQPLYYYLLRDDSASQALSPKAICSLCEALTRVYWILSGSSQIESVRDVVSRRSIRIVRGLMKTLLQNEARMSRNELREVWRHFLACVTPMLKDAGKYNRRIWWVTFVLITFRSYKVFKLVLGMMSAALTVTKPFRHLANSR
jgi:hypothetical protein